MSTLLPIEVTYRGVRSSPSLNERIHRMVESKLAPVCHPINRCDVAIEEAVRTSPGGNRVYRVRLAVTFPPSHQVVVSRTARKGDSKGTSGAALLGALQDAFRTARRRLKKRTAQRRRKG